MNIARIFHQQTMQLKWHVLASLGLIMVLPLEEAFVNLREGYGFYSSNLTAAALILGPFLAGLIACANVQADLDDRRLVFWRSKPIRVKTFMSFKFFFGLLLALVVVSLPMVFSIVSLRIVLPRGLQPEPDLLFFASWLLISVTAYGICFLSNVLVRKTARAWLIGIAVTAFMLLLPIILPMQIRPPYAYLLYAASPVLTTGLLAAAALAFLLSLAAVEHNWHLHTNLKGLLWSGAGLAFLFAFAMARQIANITVLDQAAAPETFTGWLDVAGSRIITPGLTSVSVSKEGRLAVRPIEPSAETAERLRQSRLIFESDTGLQHYQSPGPYPSAAMINDKVYAFGFDLFFSEYEENERKHKQFEKLYLSLFEYAEGVFLPESALDLSDLLGDGSYPRLLLRVVHDKVLVVVDRSLVVVQVHPDGSLEAIEKNPSLLARYTPHYNSTSYEETFSIPLIPTEQISIEQRIKFSIDMNFVFWWNSFNSSVVNADGNRIVFCIVRDRQIEKYEVVRWDEKKVWCRFVERRPFTPLETLCGSFGYNDWQFVKNGKLYVYRDTSLLVFDLRSGIRKLGHFERITSNGYISDVEVLEDGNILLSATDTIQKDRGQWERNYRLYLLENPE